MSQLAETNGSTLTLAADQKYWTDNQLAALKHIGVDRASYGDLAVFMHVCQRTGLDPFARQIYMIQRDGKQTIQTGIDGLRLVARRAVDAAKETLGISAPEWCGPDGQWADVWIGPGHPVAARVRVQRGGGSFAAVALWAEYVQTRKDGQVTHMWATRGAGQIAKCAEALALRKACPQDLAGLYTDDELGEVHAAPSPPRGGIGAVLETGQTVDRVDAEIVDALDADLDPEPLLLATSSKLAKAMYAGINGLGITDADRLPFIVSVIGREIGSTKEMTESEARAVLARVDEINDEINAVEQTMKADQ